MARATWNGVVIAETDDPVVVEGTVYFPAGSVKREHLRPSETRTTCGWKGEASYYHVVVDGESNADAAWYYPEPLKAAENIGGRVAFWKGVTVESDTGS